jgi:hypothetical protein
MKPTNEEGGRLQYTDFVLYVLEVLKDVLKFLKVIKE